MIDQVVTTKITPINMLITIGGISIFIYFAVVHAKHILQTLQEQLLKSLNRSSEKKGSEPLTKIFYNFNHSSVKAWANWVNGQDSNIQNKAFTRISDYLAEPSKKQGSLSLDAIKAIAHFNFGDGFGVLEALLENIRGEWGQLIALESNYKEALVSLKLINEEKAVETINNEFMLVKDKHNMLELKIALLEAISSIEIESDIPEQMFTEALCNNKESIKVKKKAIECICNIDNEDMREQILKKIISYYIENSDNELELEERRIYNRLLNVIGAFIDKDEVWNLFMKSYSNPALARETISVLNELITDPNYQFTPKQLYQALVSNKALKEDIIKCLSSKFKLSIEEQTVVNEKILIKEHPLSLDFVSKESLKGSYETSEFASNTFKHLLDAISSNNIRPFIVGPCNNQDLSYLLRSFASQYQKSYLFVDLNKLFITPSKLKDIEKHIETNKNIVVQWSNISKILDKISSLSLAKNIFEAINKASRNKETICVVSSNEKLNLKPEHKKLFEKVIQLDEIGERQRAQCVSYYMGKLSAQRESKEIDDEKILGYLGSLSVAESCAELVGLIKVSLLTNGQLMSLDDYKSLTSSFEEAL